jgi:hypothetical protein
MSPFDLIAGLALVVGGTCFFDGLRRLRLPSILPAPSDWVVNAEATGLSLCIFLVLFDVLSHWLAAHGGGVMPTPPPTQMPTGAGTGLGPLTGLAGLVGLAGRL